MSESRLILHCGFIKSASTSYQFDLAASDKIFLGFDPTFNNNKPYSEADIGNFFEHVVRFADCSIFNKKSEVIKKKLYKILSGAKKDVIISNECLLGKIIPFDMPNSIKIQRFSAVLPPKSIIFIIIRDLKELLFSWYMALILIGYSEDYLYFINELKILDKNFSFFDSFNLQKITYEINMLRPDVKLIIGSVDDIKNTNKILKKNKLPIIKSKRNSSIDFSNYYENLELNRKNITGMRFLDWIEIHRIFQNIKLNDGIKFRHSRLRKLHKEITQTKSLKKSLNEIKIEFFKHLPKKIEKISLSNKEKFENYNTY